MFPRTENICVSSASQRRRSFEFQNLPFRNLGSNEFSICPLLITLSGGGNSSSENLHMEIFDDELIKTGTGTAGNSRREKKKKKKEEKSEKYSDKNIPRSNCTNVCTNLKSCTPGLLLFHRPPIKFYAGS